ncbi:MAG: hypothetical protein ACLPKH_20175 [Rhodomicrobium sp.]
MRIKSNLWSAGEQMRSAENRRNAKPEGGKSKWLTSAVGGAVALGALASCGGSAYAAPITPPGETAGINSATPLPEGVYFANVFGSGGDYLVDDKKSNLTFDVPILAWSTPWQLNFLGFTGRFEAFAAAPVVGNVGIAASPGFTCTSDTCRDFTAMYQPFAEAGFAWDLGGGWAFSSFDGGYGPIDNELRIFGHDMWVYNNRSAIAWYGDLFQGGMKDGGSAIKGTFQIENIIGIVGNDVEGTRFGAAGLTTQPSPDYDNVNLTAFLTIGKWDFGLIGFYTTDTQNYNYGPAECGRAATIYTKCEQSRAGVGPLIEYDFPGISMQVDYTVDFYDENYRNLDGSRMQIQQFWLKTVIPLWNPPKMEESMK